MDANKKTPNIPTVQKKRDFTVMAPNIPYRNVIMLNDSNYWEWADSVKFRSYGYGQGGLYLRMFKVGRDTNIGAKKEPVENKGYLDCEGAPNIMVDILSSISKRVNH